MTTYLLGFTKSGLPVTRASNRSDFTHAVIVPGSSRLPSFGTSAAGALKNASTNNNTGGELVEVRAVDKARFDAAKAGKIADFESPLPKAPKTPPANLVAATLPTAYLMAPPATREGWMQAFTSAARSVFAQIDAPLPEQVRVSVGFPSKGQRSNVIGECWAAIASEDGVCEIFIRPSLQSDSARVAGVLTHELIHAAMGHGEGHGRKFGKAARALGLEGKLTATTEGAAWYAWAQPILDALGPLPGANLGKGVELAGGKKTQTTRYLKVACTSCDWTARVTAKHLQDVDGEQRTLSCPIPTCDGELEQAA